MIDYKLPEDQRLKFNQIESGDILYSYNHVRNQFWTCLIVEFLPLEGKVITYKSNNFNHENEISTSYIVNFGKHWDVIK